MKNWILVAAAVVISFALFSCKKEMAKEHEHMEQMGGMDTMSPGAETEPVIRNARADEMGKAVVCPVLGTKFNVSNVTQASDYKGKTYYFCCAECPGEFKKNPDKYAK